jgi:hypothetical protein
VSSLSKVQSITSVYFPQFIGLVRDLECAADELYKANDNYDNYKDCSDRNAKKVEEARSAYEEASKAYVRAHDKLLEVLQSFACNESFNGLYGKKSIVERLRHWTA